MPATKRPKPLYQRGDFRLYRRTDREALEIVWYDDARKRERSRSAGTGDVSAAKAALDRLYLERTGGDAFCPTCGQPRQAGGILVSSAIADFLVLAQDKPSIGSIRPRLAHVLAYLTATDQGAITCGAVDEPWIDRFRAWAIKQPILLPSGATRPRTLSTVENSVLQLASAINRCGGIKARFRAKQPKSVNRTPHYRASVDDIARMFAWCLYPDARSDKERDRRRRERANLLAFLRISVATWARPDAAHDFSTDPRRRQWHPAQRVIDLNPLGRAQTRKYRPAIPAPRQIVPLLNAGKGPFVPVASVGNVWASMEIALDLPRDGQSGMKLIRRSMGHLARQRLPEEAWGEVSMMLGHDRFDDTSDLYAPFSPTYLRRVLPITEAIIDEIEAICPGAYRNFTAINGGAENPGAAKNG